MLFSLALWLGAACASPLSPLPAPSELRVEYLLEPVGVAARLPRFSFAVPPLAVPRGTRQAAYQVVVLTLAGDKVWDSGVVQSNASLVDCGAQLASDVAYRWTAKWWSQEAGPSPEASQHFSTGLFKEADWHGAQWITAADSGHSAVELSLNFESDSPSAARVHVASTGGFVLAVNGRELTDPIGLSLWTSFDKVVAVHTVAIEDALRAGANNLTLMLGHGFGRQYGASTPSARIKLTVDLPGNQSASFTSSTAPGWRGRPSHILADDPWVGTDTDWSALGPAPAERAWGPVQLSPNKVVPQRHRGLAMPQAKVVREIAPTAATQVGPGEWLFTFPENFVGVTRWVADALDVFEDNATMSVLHGEQLEGGRCCTILSHLQGKQTDLHRVPRGASGPMLPRFSWKGFQYAEVKLNGARFKSTAESALLGSVRGLNTLTELEESEVGFYGEGAGILNSLAAIIRNSQRSNLAAWLPTDCPTREKHGWLGDSLNTVGNAMMSMFTPTLFANFLNIIRDDQVLTPSSDLHGWIPSVVPGAAQPGDISWMAAYPAEANLMRLHYGDLRPAADHWPALALWADAIIEKAERPHKPCASCGTEPGGAPDFFTWGDWCAAEERSAATSHTGRPLAVANMLMALDGMAQMAGALGKHGEASKYSAARGRYAEVFHSRFYNASTGIYNADTGDPLTAQSLNAAALAAGVVPPQERGRVLAALRRDTEVRGLSVGATGATHLLSQLARNGANDVASTLAMSTSYPSWGNWLLHNATTCWESWDGFANPSHPPPPTHNHIFLCGGLGEYLYADLVGITPVRDGYAVASVAPIAPLPAGVDGARATVRTVRGPISAGWQLLSGGGLLLNVSLPVHVEADVAVPLLNFREEAAEVDLDGGAVFRASSCVAPLPAGVAACRAQGGAVRLRVLSGRYSFALRPSAVVYV